MTFGIQKNKEELTKIYTDMQAYFKMTCNLDIDKETFYDIVDLVLHSKVKDDIMRRVEDLSIVELMQMREILDANPHAEEKVQKKKKNKEKQTTAH